MKKCNNCGEYKELGEFHNQNSAKDGKMGKCKICRNIAMKLYRENNKEKVAIINKEWRENNKEKVTVISKRWYENNKEKEKERKKEYRKNNRDKCNATLARYKAAKIRAIPCWYKLEEAFISFMYEKANELSLTIDHIVPFQHKLVCGLHTIANLQIMSFSENSAKCNNFEIT